MGASWGHLSLYGLKFIGSAGDWKQILLTILGAALSGLVLVFIGRFKTTGALGAYCVGLLVAYMWAYTPTGVEAFQSADPNTHIIGLLHLGGLALISLVSAALFLPTGFPRTLGQQWAQ